MSPVGDGVILRTKVKLYDSVLTYWWRDKMAMNVPDDIFKGSFLNESVYISITISPKFVPKGPNNNIPDNALVPSRWQAIFWINGG